MQDVLANHFVTFGHQFIELSGKPEILLVTALPNSEKILALLIQLKEEGVTKKRILEALQVIEEKQGGLCTFCVNLSTSDYHFL